MRFKINPRLVPICIYYFFLCFGNSILWPYFTLQMRSIGLTLSDVALVGGLAPVIAFIATPLFGYIGDKVGYKIILVFSIFLDIGTSASLNFLPVYREHVPKIALNTKSFNMSSAVSIEKSDIAWFGYVSSSEHSCEPDVSSFILGEVMCEDKKFIVDISFQESDPHHLVENQCSDMNSTSCMYTLNNLQFNSSFTICDTSFKDFDSTFKQGSHSLTFWTYFAIRTLLMIAMNACYNISDAAAATVSKREGSSFSRVMIFGSIGNLLPPLIMGVILDRVNLNSQVFDCVSGIEITAQDFKVPFSISNGLLLIMAVFTFGCLDIQVEKPAQKLSFKEEFSWLANPAALAFYLFMFEFGFSQGAGDNFLFVFAQEELGASATLLGYMQEAGQISSLIMLLFANFLIKRLGSINMICVAIFFLCGELVLVGITSTSPPWQLIGYKALDGFFPLHWCSIIAYCGKIAPASLTATAISLCSCLLWIAGKGVGTLLAGYLIEKFSLSLMFIIIGTNGMISSILYWMVYHMFLKKHEINYEVNEPKKGEVNDEFVDDYERMGSSYSTRL